MSLWHRICCLFGKHEVAPDILIFAGASWGASCKHCRRTFWKRWQ